MDECEIDDRCIKIGRGPITYNHKGNIRFRQMVEKHLPEYRASPKAKKTQLVNTVHQELRKKGMQFVRKEHGVWKKVTSEEEVRKKVAHRFRDAIESDKKRVTIDETNPCSKSHLPEPPETIVSSSSLSRQSTVPRDENDTYSYNSSLSAIPGQYLADGVYSSQSAAGATSVEPSRNAGTLPSGVSSLERQTQKDDNSSMQQQSYHSLFVQDLYHAHLVSVNRRRAAEQNETMRTEAQPFPPQSATAAAIDGVASRNGDQLGCSAADSGIEHRQPNEMFSILAEVTELIVRRQKR